MTTFDERLREALQASGVTRAALAKALGVTHQAVAQALSGNTKGFTAINNALAAKVLGVSPLWLATGKGLRQDLGERLGPLTEAEVTLIEVLRALPEEVRNEASAAARQVANEYLSRVTALVARSGA